MGRHKKITQTNVEPHVRRTLDESLPEVEENPKDKYKIRKGVPKNVWMFYEYFIDCQPVDLQNADITALENRTREFFEFVKQEAIKPTMTAYAVALGYSRDQIINIKNGHTPAPRDVVAYIKRIYVILDDYLSQLYLDNSFVTPGTIFEKKNNFGWSDQQEVVVAHRNLLATDQTADDVMRKYALESVPQLDVVDTVQPIEVPTKDAVPIEAEPWNGIEEDQ